MGVPGWLLKIIIGFLSERELIVRYKGCESERKRLPGGSLQGTRLGIFLFLFIWNGKDIYDKLAVSESEAVSGKFTNFAQYEGMQDLDKDQRVRGGDQRVASQPAQGMPGLLAPPSNQGKPSSFIG